MKKYILIITIIAGFMACKSTPKESEVAVVAGTYGDSTFVPDFAWNGQTLLDSLNGRDSIYAKVTGEISAACQTKGCWMTMKAGNEELFVKFKDYGFFVPMNSAGYNATMLGWAFVDTVSVKDQQEYAKDAKKTDEEIAAITEPEVKYTFLAEGVIIE